MNDILLTHDQQGAAIDIALERCTRDRELSAVHTVAEEVARAQVRKVAEWAEMPFDVEACPPWSSQARHRAACRLFGHIRNHEADDAACRKCWTAWSLTENVAALKAAGEKEVGE